MAGLDPTRSSDEIDDRVKPICINPSRAATQNEISSADQAANSLAALTIDLPDPELLPSSQSHGSTASLVSFSKLPRELRLKIWRMAMPETRLVNIGPLFPTPAGRLYICECRTEASQAQIGEEDEHIPVTSAVSSFLFNPSKMTFSGQADFKRLANCHVMYADLSREPERDLAFLPHRRSTPLRYMPYH